MDHFLFYDWVTSCSEIGSLPVPFSSVQQMFVVTKIIAMHSLQAKLVLFLRAVWNQWNGMVEWNSGMEYWNDLLSLKSDIQGCYELQHLRIRY